MTKYRLVEKGVLGLLSVLMGAVAFLASCGGGRSSDAHGGEGRDVEMRYAENLRITEHAGYTEVSVRNPWDTVNVLQRYILVARDSMVPANLPEGTVVRTPVRNALVYSTIHSSLISEMGASNAIGGLCNAEYVNDRGLKARLAKGEIADCGVSESPDIEKIIQLSPDLIMLSPYEHNDRYVKVGSLGIPILECADYMETSPLGRAEWLKFYGRLFGRAERCDSLFAQTERNYLRLKELAMNSSEHPKVLIDRRYGQVWNVPGGRSTMGRMIEDAGGVNPFAGYAKSGSVALAPERVLAEAHDADVWLIRYNQPSEKTLAELGKEARINSRFKAFKEGRVYGCNTRYVDFYEETPFHPDYLLEDMIGILHKEHQEKGRYFKRL